MKAVNENLKGRWNQGLAKATVLKALIAMTLCSPLGALAIDAIVLSGNGTADAAAPPVAVPPRYSAGIGDILKMADAKVDPEIIKAYVRNSPTAYNPSVSEIIMLKDHGVPPEIITTVIQHGGELRAQNARVAQMAPTAPPNYQTQPYPTAPPQQAYAPQAVYPDYSTAYPDYSYAYPASSVYYVGGGYGGYGGYCGYGGGCYGGYYGWPSCYWGWGNRGYCGYPYWGSGYRNGWCGYGWNGRGGYCNYNRGFYGGFGARTGFAVGGVHSFNTGGSFNTVHGGAVAVRTGGGSFSGGHASFGGGGGHGGGHR